MALQTYDTDAAQYDRIKTVPPRSGATTAQPGVGPGVFTAALVNDLITQLRAAAINPQIGSSYVITSDDANKVVTFNSAGPVSVVIPSGLGAGFSCGLVQLGLGTVNIGGDGVSVVNSYLDQVSLAGQFAAASVVAYATDTFLLSGALI